MGIAGCGQKAGLLMPSAFCKSKEKKVGITPDFRPRLIRKVDYVLYYTKEKSGSEQRIVLTRIINKGINQVGGSKPLVFDLARIHNGGIELTQMRRRGVLRLLRLRNF